MRYKPFIVALLVVAIAIVYGFAIRDLVSPKANIELSLSPTNALVKLDTDQTAKAGTLYLAPGTYSARITADGFSTDTKTFTVKPTGTVQVIAILNPISDTARQFLSDNEDEQLHRESLSGKLVGANADDITTTYPIIALLPHSGDGYSINYGSSVKHPSDPRYQALYVTTDNDSYKPRALSWIRYQGYNPDNYEIVYQSNDARD